MNTEALARRDRSILTLKKEGIPYLTDLPVIETEAEAKRRSAEEVADRAIALSLVAVKGEGLDQETLLKILAKYGREDSFTAKEKSFIHNPFPTEHDRVQFTWRYECYWVLLWALGFIDQLSRPDGICDVPRATSILMDLGRAGFLKSANLLPMSEILDAADLIYRYHWAVVDARVNGKELPSGLDPGVVMERHYALNWLIGAGDEDWDDIHTNT
ncbi:MAG TPA: DUF4272 domain-containing protein [Planctomycetota bacterium]|nr:DUF4272 domain-containing protein [Planctomycetota bacterium]